MIVRNRSSRQRVGLVAGEHLGGDLERRGRDEVRRLLVRVDERLDLASQLGVVRTGACEEDGALGRVNLQRGVIQLANLPIAFGRHTRES